MRVRELIDLLVECDPNNDIVLLNVGNDTSHEVDSAYSDSVNGITSFIIEVGDELDEE
jgi:hypothetical protein